MPSPNAAAASRRAAATRVGQLAPADSDDPHALAAAARGGLHQRRGKPSSRRRPATSHDGRTGTPDVGHQPLGGQLVAHDLDDLGGGPTQISPASITARAKSARSERNP